MPIDPPASNRPIDRALVWFRRDLRADDHAALYAACRAAHQVLGVFVFDTDILDALPRRDRRVEFIRDSVVDLDDQLHALGEANGVPGVRLAVVHGAARTEIPRLARMWSADAVFAAHDDDPFALARDAAVRDALQERGQALHTVKDHVVFERSELLTGTGKPYSVFTPYKTAWLKKANAFYLSGWPVHRHAHRLAPWPTEWAPAGVPPLSALGFEATDLGTVGPAPGTEGADALLAAFLERIDDYDRTRDFPAVRGPSHLGAHLRFGTVSVRRLAREAWQRIQAGSRGAEVWLSELIWRDFYHQVLHHHPHVVGGSFKPAYDHLRWHDGPDADERFEAWCAGRTGYPLVDAAMHQLVNTGYMHNRLRMVAASFLVKDLGVDWRRGEAWFARWLTDYDLAANNGGWQWAASTGCDAQPWFRIFNPVTQSEKFDPDGRFIRQFVPSLARLNARDIHAPWLAKPAALQAAGVALGRDYPRPIVDHAAARERTLARYAAARD